MSAFRWILVAACTVPLTHVQAQELVVRDLRLCLASRPVGFDYTMSSPTSQRSGSDAFSSGVGLEGGARWSFIRSGDRIGLLAGADLRLDGYGYDDGGSMTEQGLRLCAGIAAAIDDRWSSAVEFGWTAGRTQLSLAGNSSLPALDAQGTTNGWDLRLTCERMLTRRFGLGTLVGWESSSKRLTRDSTSLTFDQAGWFLGLEARWRFHDRPPLLD